MQQINDEESEEQEDKSRKSSLLDDARDKELAQRHAAYKNEDSEIWKNYLSYIDDLVSKGLIQAVSTR